MISDNEHLFMYLAICMSFLGEKMSLQVLCPVFNEVLGVLEVVFFFFLLLSCLSVLYVLESNLLSDS